VPATAAERPQRLHHRRAGQDPDPTSGQPPVSATAPRSPASLASSATSRVLPTPASPAPGDGGPTRRDPFGRRPELGDLGVAPDQDWTEDPPGHASDHPGCRPGT
jgi:hypothetical protein